MGSSGRSMMTTSMDASRTQALSNIPREYGKHVSCAFSITVVDELVFARAGDYAELSHRTAFTLLLQLCSASQAEPSFPCSSEREINPETRCLLHHCSQSCASRCRRTCFSPYAGSGLYLYNGKTQFSMPSFSEITRTLGKSTCFFKVPGLKHILPHTYSQGRSASLVVLYYTGGNDLELILL